MRTFLKKFDDAVYSTERVVIVGALITMTLIIFAQVVLRFFARGFPWAEELARYLMIWSGFLGASIATRQRRHLKVDLLTRFLPEGRAKALVMRLAALISAGFCFFLVGLGTQFVLNSFRGGRVSSSMGLPIWLVQLSIPLTVLIIACRFLGQAFGELKTTTEIDHFLTDVKNDEHAPLPS